MKTGINNKAGTWVREMIRLTAFSALAAALFAGCPDPEFPVYQGDDTVGPFVKYVLNPVIRRGQAGSFDDVGIGAPSVIREQGGRLRMFFSAYNSAGLETIGTAVSRDGIVWDKKSDGPVLTPTAGLFDEAGVSQPSAIYDGRQYWLYYTGRSNDGKARIGLASSPDGIVFSKVPSAVLEGAKGSFDEGGTGAPSVVFDAAGGFFLMAYAGTGSDGLGRIMFAVSKNGTSWTRHGQDKGAPAPVLIPSSKSGDFDTWSLDGPFIMRVDTKENRRLVRMWYGGVASSGGSSHVGLAGGLIDETGALERGFERYGANPVLHYAHKPGVVGFESDYFMYFTEAPFAVSSGISLATRFELGGTDGGK
jgi:predicted GH43/DUF377 family glycosyl hydrolase